MKNKPIIVDGKIVGWDDRSNAVAIFPIVHDITNAKSYILAEQRGSGCPDFVGYWAVPCGYLDKDETRKEAAKREFLEELGADLPVSDFIEWEIDDDPKHDPKQNVVTRYILVLDIDIAKEIISSKYWQNSEERGGEAGEVSDLRLIPLDLEELKKYSWAFNQDTVLERALDTFLGTKDWV